jgi:hypothetical protein
MPLISFVVAAYRKPERLELCLRALRNQVFTDFEIIVTDDGSPPGENDAVAEKYGAQFVTHERTLHPTGGYPTRNMPAVMNAGVGAAQGVIVQTLQEDHIVAPDFALWLARTFRHDTITFGLTDHDDARQWTTADVDNLLRLLHLPDGEARYDDNADHGRAWVLPFPNWRHTDGLDAAFNRAVWGTGLDTDFIGQGHEWLDLMLRWKLSDLRFAVSPMMRLYHLDEPPALNKSQWQAELAVSYQKMIAKWQFDVWSQTLVPPYPFADARAQLHALQEQRGLV